MKKQMVILTVLVSFLACKKDDGPKTCPTGYTGNDCSEEITPTQVTVTGVRLLSYPPKDSDGGDWDTFSAYADPYIEFVHPTTAQVRYTTEQVEELPPTVEHEWETDFRVSAHDAFALIVRDDDGADPSDWVTNFYWLAYTKGEGFPAEKVLEDLDGYKIKLYLAYRFD